MSRKIEVDLSSVRTADDLMKLVDDGDLTREDVVHLFERNRLPKAVMVELDREAGGHYSQPGLQDVLSNTRNTGDIGAATEDDIILEDDGEGDEDSHPRSRGRRGRKSEGEEE